MKAALLFVIITACARACYWNRECPYLPHSTKSPYHEVRGDIRDLPKPENCDAISVWTLNRHGNRNPGTSVTEDVKYIASLREEIIASFEAGRSRLCTEDIVNFRTWVWNSTLEESQSYLTGEGYEELFGIGSRIRQTYPHLLEGSDSDYYLRPTNEQRTITSAMAFAHGFFDGSNVTVTPDDPWSRDDVVRPYENCDRYQETVKSSQLLDDQMDAYYKTAEFIAVQNTVQQRLGLTTQLTPADIYSLYELCRFDRSWSDRHQSPWCAAFSNHDLVVLEYRDDVRHYYRNGYGSWVNVNLGGPAMKDLYETFEDAVHARSGQGRKLTSYFTHDTMLEMVWCALGIFKDPSQLEASFRNPSRVWRTSFIGAFSVNMIAVLNRCQEADGKTFRVQIFINEKETELCPVDIGGYRGGAMGAMAPPKRPRNSILSTHSEGCTWQQFQDMFQRFGDANLDFCSMSYIAPEVESNRSVAAGGVVSLVAAKLAMLNVLR